MPVRKSDPKPKWQHVPDVTRLTVLKAAFDCLAYASQWVPGEATKPTYSASFMPYLHRAEALIELLEVQDCGSTGGFDPTMPPEKHGRLGLPGRFVWVLEKYHTKADIDTSRNDCWTVDRMCRFYRETGKVRDKIFQS